MTESTIAAQATDEEFDTKDYDWHEEAATFGDRMVWARESQSMTQADLARRLGVRTSTIMNWESDRSEPRSNRLQMLAGLLNVSIVWLMTGHGEGSPDTNGTEQLNGDLPTLLGTLRDLRLEQARLADRMALLEKRLRAALANN